jgi:hypothetical protein
MLSFVRTLRKMSSQCWRVLKCSFTSIAVVYWNASHLRMTVLNHFFVFWGQGETNKLCEWIIWNLRKKAEILLWERELWVWFFYFEYFLILFWETNIILHIETLNFIQWWFADFNEILWVRFFNEINERILILKTYIRRIISIFNLFGVFLFKSAMKMSVFFFVARWRFDIMILCVETFTFVDRLGSEWKY